MNLKTALLLHLGVGLPVMALILLPGWVGLKHPPATFEPVPDFALTDHDKEPFRASDLRGKVTVVDFVFTQCRGICPTLHAQMQAVRHRFAGSADLQMVSISVDPDNDTPERLADFRRSQGLEDPRWRFLTGPREDIRGLLEGGFKIGLPDDPQTHSDRFVLVDRAGVVRGYYSVSDPARIKRLMPDIAKLLKKPGDAEASPVTAQTPAPKGPGI